MQLWESIYDFFRRLVKSRVDSVGIGANAKVKNVQVRSKSKVANQFNSAIDKMMGKKK